MGNFLVRYASRVVIYDRRAVIRLATDIRTKSNLISSKSCHKLQISRKVTFSKDPKSSGIFGHPLWQN